MQKKHQYVTTLKWTGNKGEGTKTYTAYDRDYIWLADNKAPLEGSADPAFRGDATKYNPEELLLASLSGCHMLSYLHLCAVAGVVVTNYVDQATGIMEETADGGGHYTEVTLHPVVTVTDASMIDKANELHKRASELCFIASSVNFPVHHQPMAEVERG